jgi:hypothetical protein
MDRFTLTMDPELYNLLKDRSKYNHRSMNGECIYLIEAALASEVDGNMAILRTLMMAQGGVKSLQTPVPEDHSPEHIGTDESENESLASLQSHPEISDNLARY